MRTSDSVMLAVLYLLFMFVLTGAQVMEFCPHGTKVECTKVNSAEPCKKLHFKKIIQKHTDESLGDCSFLNTCFHMDTCKYVFALLTQNGLTDCD
jgi:mRNA (2'-O-methyladenosine-N6-)-methyltransferase